MYLICFILGLAKELFTDADNFFVTFPPNSTSTQRALLLGALFLIDFLYFEVRERLRIFNSYFCRIITNKTSERNRSLVFEARSLL